MAESRSASWKARAGTVRVRTTFAAVVVVGLALLAGAIGLVVVLRHSLTSNVRATVALRATDVAEVLETGTSPRSLSLDGGEDSFVQVLDGAGRVLAASRNVAGHPAVARLGHGQSAEVEGLPVDDDEFLVFAAGAETARGRVVVLAGRTLEAVGDATTVAVRALLLGVPLLLVVVAVTAWRMVGRALKPVEAMRAEVDAISAAELHRRVPSPAGDDEIARLAATMNRMLARLEEARARERRFVSDASHELRSPVATIRQHVEVALAHPERASTKDLAAVVLEEDLRLERLVDDLLFLARSDEGMLSVTRRPVDLDDLVLEEATRLRATTALRIDATGVSAGRVTGDPGQLRRLIRNLADNAARHARAVVRLSLGQSDGAVRLSVHDDGPGIPVEEREHVFERFVRLDDARARGAGGAGLGLAIAAEIAAAHGGAVTLGESPLGGAGIEVRLPAERD